MYACAVRHWLIVSQDSLLLKAATTADSVASAKARFSNHEFLHPPIHPAGAVDSCCGDPSNKLRHVCISRFVVLTTPKTGLSTVSLIPDSSPTQVSVPPAPPFLFLFYFFLFSTSTAAYMYSKDALGATYLWRLTGAVWASVSCTAAAVFCADTTASSTASPR